MTKSSLVAFAVTIGIAVPAGWRVLDADMSTDGAKLRPELKHATIGDAEVTMQLDRGAILAGNTISATLVATADRAHDVTVKVTAFEDEGYGEGRVPLPPRTVGKRTLKLHAAPGGGPPVVATFAIAKASPGSAGWYYIDASGRGNDDGTASAGFAVFGANELGLAIDAPDKVAAMGSFTIAIHVKNTTKQPLASINATVGGKLYEPGLEGQPQIAASSEFAIEAAGDLTRDGDEDDTKPLAPGAERILLYRVVPHDIELDELTVVAEVTGTVRDANGEWKASYRATETHTFVRPPAAGETKSVAAE